MIDPGLAACFVIVGRDTVPFYGVIDHETCTRCVGECGIAIRVQHRSDAFELAADLRPADVIEEKPRRASGFVQTP